SNQMAPVAEGAINHVYATEPEWNGYQLTVCWSRPGVFLSLGAVLPGLFTARAGTIVGRSLTTACGEPRWLPINVWHASSWSVCSSPLSSPRHSRLRDDCRLTPPSRKAADVR